jgi:poly(beta-D-mannuronate) lyase
MSRHCGHGGPPTLFAKGRSCIRPKNAQVLDLKSRPSGGCRIKLQLLAGMEKDRMGAVFTRSLLACCIGIALAQQANAASLFEPAANPAFCPTSMAGLDSGSGVQKYPGELPARLDQDFSQYRKIYQSNIDDFMHAYADYIMMLGGAASVSKESRDMLREEIVNNAKREPIKYNARAKVPPNFHVILVMAPMTIAYAQRRNDYTPDEQKLIEAWIEKKINVVLRDSYLGSVDTDNKKYFLGVWLAAYGEATGKKKYTKRAISIYKRAIDKQRKDGSLKHDSQRGGSAIHYTNQAVASLVTLAESLSNSGFDAYGYSKGPRSLHSIVKFLLDATENPKLIAGYASDPEWSKSSFHGYSANKQALHWMKNHSASWGYYYLNRYGDSDLGKRLKTISPFLSDGRMGVFENAGGNPLCVIGNRPL